MKKLFSLLILLSFGCITASQAQEKHLPQQTGQSSLKAEADQKTSSKIKCGSSISSPAPLYLMITNSGEMALNQQQISKLSPTWIQEIAILKEKKAIEKYEKEGENGVILITLKPENHKEALALMKAAQ